MNYLLIDFENVQPRSLALLDGHPFKIAVFVGANQTKIGLELARTLQSFGKDAAYVQVSGSGRNALDFHIAFTLGKLVTQERHANDKRNASYHIISRDTGFDPLIRHLKGKGIDVHRLKEIGDIPLLRVANSKGADEKLDAIVGNLSSRGSSKPRKVRTLKNTINAMFAKSLQDADLNNMIEGLAKRGVVTIEGDNVSYHAHGGG